MADDAGLVIYRWWGMDWLLVGGGGSRGVELSLICLWKKMNGAFIISADIKLFFTVQVSCMLEFEDELNGGLIKTSME